MKRIVSFFCCILYCSLSFFACQQSTSNNNSSSPQLVPLNVSLNMTQARYKIGHPITLRFVLKNNQQVPISFCPFNSPAHKVWTNCFIIKDKKGQIIPFIGKTAHYQENVSQKDLIEIEAEGIRIYTLDIRTLYQLDKAGRYKLYFKGDNINNLPNSLPAQFTLE